MAKERIYRGVHLDLKGMPPAAKRLVELPALLRELGLTAVLVEWEDTFPFRRFPELKASYTYSLKTVRQFLARAEKAGLLVIPLIQTFGHLESLLRQRKYRGLREQPTDPANLCPMHPQAGKVISALIGDVVRLHAERSMPYFHLGGDEVWSLGSCPKCRKFVQAHDKAALYLRHMDPLIDQINASGARAIIWHDMMRDWPRARARSLAGRADLMFWNYSSDRKALFGFARPEEMKRYASLGVGCWGAAAYKGADGVYRNLPDLHHRAENTRLWHEAARAHHLKGVVLTAWSRYNTLITCCEPLEACWESLALCSRVLKKGAFSLVRDAASIRRSLFGTADPERHRPVKHRRLWETHAAIRELDEWGQGFDGRIIDRVKWVCPKLWGENRINVSDTLKLVKAAGEELRKASALAARVRQAFRGVVVDDEIEAFLASRITLRRKIWRGIEKEIRPLMKE